tara:strand:- start:2291 stop:2518 length:228 start_codon:yes stop_codon:yes gene_type:complete
MFATCSKIENICPFCTHSDYNQRTVEHDGVIREYCGMITGSDCTTEKLPKCWLKMSKYQKSKHKRENKIYNRGGR